MADLVYPGIVALARGVFKVQGLRFTMQGTEHVPRRGGAVMCINHVGYLDFTYAGLAAAPSGRLVRFMAKEEVFTHRVSGPLMRAMHHIPVDRAAGAGSFRAAVSALRAGEVVGVFPEATISRSFELKDTKAGVVRMAAEGAVPILPTVVWGSQRVWTKGRSRHLGRTKIPITVEVGPPMTVAGRTDFDVVMDELRARMTGMLHRVQEAYVDRPSGPDDAWWLPARLGGSAPTPEEAHQLDRAELRERLAAAKAARDDASAKRR